MLMVISGGNSPISQAELVAVVALENKLAALAAMRDRLLAGILNRLEAGAEVEPGTHEAELMERTSHGRKRLWVEVR
jgi:hypothetical protein